MSAALIFQYTSPQGMFLCFPNLSVPSNFNTHPRRGCFDIVTREVNNDEISIHIPAGDVSFPRSVPQFHLKDFNTHPRRGCFFRRTAGSSFRYFNTHPRRGCFTARRKLGHSLKNFNTHPRRGCFITFTLTLTFLTISIHIPAGDVSRKPQLLFWQMIIRFQYTSPQGMFQNTVKIL